jgi:GWxTD domain-containing protein
MIFFLFLQIEYQAVNRTISDSVSLLALYLNIPSQKLHYIAHDNDFYGQYEIQLTVYDKSDNQLAGDYWRRAVVQDTSDIRDSVTLRIPQKSEYYLLKIFDLQAGEIFTAKQTIIQIRHLGDLSWEVKNDTLKLRFTVFNQPSNLDSIVAEVGEAAKTIQTQRGTYHDSIAFDVAALPIADYVLKLAVYSDLGNIDESVIEVKVSRPFYLDDNAWSLKVDQLQYIASQSEMNTLKGTTVSERDSLWHEFWMNRDPTPNTVYNEKEVEYFERIAYAEAHFSNGDQGWRSDRARVFIKYGPPDELQSFPYEIDSFPYEVWIYYKSNLRFVFLDRYGFGRYILINPEGMGI